MGGAGDDRGLAALDQESAGSVEGSLAALETRLQEVIREIERLNRMRARRLAEPPPRPPADEAG